MGTATNRMLELAFRFQNEMREVAQTYADISPEKQGSLRDQRKIDALEKAAVRLMNRICLLENDT